MSISDKRIEYGSEEAADKQKALREAGNMNAGFLEMARDVYAHLNDEISKKIFEARLLYASTRDLGCITGLESKYRNLNSDMQVYVEKIQKGSHCLIYGAGVAGHYLAGRYISPQALSMVLSRSWLLPALWLKLWNHLLSCGILIQLRIIDLGFWEQYGYTADTFRPNFVFS